jgi:CheY-like chemotaxis protein
LRLGIPEWANPNRSIMKNIMIIDDDAEDAMLLLEVIQKISPESKCSVSHSYQSAKNLLDEEAAPDYIFLDALMYPIGGKETLMLLAGMDKLADTMIIINSGMITQAIINEFSDLGADHVMQKPPDYHSLISSVKEILSTR